MIFSKGKAFPKYQTVFIDLKIHLMHQIKLYYECEEYFSKNLLFLVISIHCHNTYQTIMLEVMIFQIYRKLIWEQ
jgi:hypothetical protein